MQTKENLTKKIVSANINNKTPETYFSLFLVRNKVEKYFSLPFSPRTCIQFTQSTTILHLHRQQYIYLYISVNLMQESFLVFYLFPKTKTISFSSLLFIFLLLGRFSLFLLNTNFDHFYMKNTLVQFKLNQTYVGFFICLVYPFDSFYSKPI